MKLPTTLTLLLVLVVSVSCGPATDAGCAGWRDVRVADATVDYLAAHDEAALEALIAHHETGQRLGCWK